MRTHRSSGHLVDISCWPILTSMGVFGMCSGLVSGMHMMSWTGLKLGFLVTILTMTSWLRDVIREGTYEGEHNERVLMGLKLGIVLFIISELMFFVAFFWGYLWFSTTITISIGGIFAPLGVDVISSKGVALMNTVILLSSGVSITWCHHSLISGDRKESVYGLSLTILLALVFSLFQGYEYFSSGFSINDSVFGSAFFMTTGFHGFHVIIGSIMLSVGLVRIRNYEITRIHHVGLEAGIWYWHFVDVVWLFVFVLMYVLV